jgi:hypothetical protein
MKTLFLILFIVFVFFIFCETTGTLAASYGDLAKRSQCLLIFIVSTSGTNTTERGTCICDNYKDARIDETGVGTLHLTVINKIYTDCTQSIPIRIELDYPDVWQEVNRWSLHECKRRFRKSTCVIVTSLMPPRNTLELPVYSNPYAIRPTTMKVKLVDGLLKREVGIG